MAGLDFTEKMQKASERMGINNGVSLEHMLGTGLMQPFSGSNSGARKIMWNVHQSHRFMLMNGEKAIIETGYEIRFGDESSSIIKADSDYRIIAKISKFSFTPNHHYWLILEDIHNKRLDVVERISYEYVTESYGYLYNNEYMDSVNPGDIINKGTIIQKSLAFDEYNNRRDGVNFNVCYMALDDNMEDSIVFSDKAASRLSAPLIKPVQIMINDNDIPLNIYGDDKTYKVIPDIGEDVIDANLIALRKEKKEESYFNQSVDRLRKIVMSDDTKQVHGRVIDVDIYCNNPEILDNHYYAQLKMYYNELNRRCSEIVKFVLPYVSQGYELSYELQKLFSNAKRVCNGDQYTDKRPFSNIILEVTLLEEKTMDAGDKASNRYGGKGVCSDIWPQELMPRFKNSKGEYEYIDVIFNSSTMIGRMNVGQVFELSINHIGNEILHRISTGKCSLDEAYDMIHKYVEFCSPEQASYMDEKKASMSREDLMFYIESIIESGSIHLSMRPLTDYMTIDKLAEMYAAFPWVEQNEIEVAMLDSTGHIRYLPARRKMVVGKQYICRLKQYSEEKFSATSLSATNIRNENTKSRARKDFRELYPNTPIRFGNMETANMNHIGADAVVANMMIHSLSPQGRRLVEQMYTGDPFNIDIKLDSDSKNRSAEIANTYLKTIGRRLVFIKRKKDIKKILVSPIIFKGDPTIKPISFIPNEIDIANYDVESAFKEREKRQKTIKKKNIQSPINFMGVSRDKDGKPTRV